LKPHNKELRFEAVTSLAGTESAMKVFSRAWGADALSGKDTYFAAASHGCYLGVGWLQDQPVTAAFGFLSVDKLTDGPALHSHMAATDPAYLDNGFGFAMKTHQRLWAKEHGLVAITWTYDPLQRRNAWFNLARLGASVVGFHENLYGALNDEINGSVETDRFEVRLDVNVEQGAPVYGEANDVLIPVPESIDRLRAEDLTLATKLQIAMRKAMRPVSVGSHFVRGISGDRCYVLSPVVGRTS
jgi:predicted GNAT superfamily acetyltransferase